MPPPKETRQLTAREKELLKRWISQGAEYQAHWAYIPPVKPELPKEGGLDSLVARPVDCFIDARLSEIGLKPSPEADRTILARRLYFDLTGLPPSPPDVEKFLNDASPATDMPAGIAFLK